MCLWSTKRVKRRKIICWPKEINITLDSREIDLKKWAPILYNLEWFLWQINYWKIVYDTIKRHFFKIKYFFIKYSNKKIQELLSLFKKNHGDSFRSYVGFIFLKSFNISLFISNHEFNGFFDKNGTKRVY